MKTKNNVQKAVLRFAAIVVSFVLISYTVSAQDFWKRFLENSSFGHIAMIMANEETTTVESDDFASAADLMERETENKLELEPWMTNEANFAVVSFETEQLADEALELESWMMDEFVFQTATESDPALELEAWMVSDAVWNN
jgi:hypothetical protein